MRVSGGGGPGGTLVTTTAYALGRGAGKVAPVAKNAGAAARVAPLAGAAAVGSLWAVVCGFVNLRKHRKGVMTKREAVRETVGESVGTGVAAGAGIAAANAVRGSALVFSSVALAPFLVGTAVTGCFKMLWDWKTKKKRPARAESESREAPLVSGALNEDGRIARS